MGGVAAPAPDWRGSTTYHHERTSPMQRRIRCTIAVLVAIGLRASATSCWAGFDEGLRSYERGDYALALREFRLLAEQGNADAQYNLGVMYAKGLGVPQDYVQAIQWFRRAAEQGNANAQYNLGLMYANGQGVPQDYTQAVQWYRRAAEQGRAEAQNDLGVMYAKGQCVPQDYAQAYGWFNLAAAHLPPGANRETVIRNRDRLTAWLTPAQLADAQARARTWQPKPETPSSSSAPSPGLAVPVRGAPPETSPPTSLRRDLIRAAQERLQAAGFHPGSIDGSMGPQTRNALRWFQNTKGLPATGELDEKTLNALGVR